MGVRTCIDPMKCLLEGADHSCWEDRSQRSSCGGDGVGGSGRPYRLYSQGLKQSSLSSLTHLSISGPAQTVSWSDLDGPLFGRKAMTNLVCVLKSRDITASKGVYGQSYGFSSSPVRMWELDYKESWVPENWWFWTVVLEKTLESPLDCKEIQPVNPRENQSWIFIGRTDAKAETPILWPPDAKSRLIGEDSDARRDWRQKEKRAAKDEMGR